MELPGVNPLGSMVAYAVEAPLRKMQMTTRVDPSDRTRDGSADSHQRPEQETAAAEARDIAALRREMQRRDLPAGPPPAFRISLLEAEGGLEQVLARIEAVRSQSRDAPALRLTSDDATAAHDVESRAPVATGAFANDTDSDPATSPIEG